jgi:pimeloyl-[acyl-carrier protein] methyl ester esterase
MSRPTLLFLHGWGFAPSMWTPLRVALPEFDAVAWDRGYFDAPTASEIEGPVLAVGHSLGALLLAAGAPKASIGLVAINGFDRFTGDEAVPTRVIERMRKRFAEAPAEVLADFRTRCGADGAPSNFDATALAADLALLAEADARGVFAAPILALHGADDPILGSQMRGTVFAGAVRETFPEAGHLLPLTHSGWCADRIRAFADTLE